MAKLSNYRVLFLGASSPLAAVFLYVLVSLVLKRLSSDLEKDWLFRLSLSAAAMTLPFLMTLVLAMKDRRRGALLLSGKIGLAVATLSLALVWIPASDGITRWKQSRNMAMRDVDAPPFVTLDLYGKIQRLQDHKGNVVLVNIWATWCVPCREEMPKLERLYQQHRDQGLAVFGLSDENVDLQQKYAKQVNVTYPLLTLRGQVPNFYRDIARYPAIFLIDRQGKLQPAPGPDQSFDKLEAAVIALLNHVSNEVSQTLVGKQITIRGRFLSQTKGDPCVVLDNQQAVYIGPRESRSEGTYSTMEGKLVEATGTLRFYHDPTPFDETRATQRLPDHFYFEAESTQLRLISP